MNPKVQNIIAIVIGWATIVAVGVLLFPLLTVCLDNSVEASFEKGIKINRSAISIYENLFIAITVFCGGFVTCWIAKGRKMFYSSVSGIILFITLTTLGIIISQSLDFSSIFKALLIIPFMIMGGLVRKLVENNKAN